MKISDLLGEGWESEERSDAPLHPPVPEPAEPGEPPSPDVIPSLASWAPARPTVIPEPSAAPVSARAQLADLAAGLAPPPSSAPVETEAELLEAPADLADLAAVVDDLLPPATKRTKGSSRGSSRIGSRRRGR